MSEVDLSEFPTVRDLLVEAKRYTDEAELRVRAALGGDDPNREFGEYISCEDFESVDLEDQCDWKHTHVVTLNLRGMNPTYLVKEARAELEALGIEQVCGFDVEYV